mmetsp:Transcript_20006/g.47677  ORF Transcript_20006/g.47677 Transcript_20006/m.47677 type:complete len:212 (+) Transcript_20006:1936-2571(+)
MCTRSSAGGRARIRRPLPVSCTAVQPKAPCTGLSCLYSRTLRPTSSSPSAFHHSAAWSAPAPWSRRPSRAAAAFAASGTSLPEEPRRSLTGLASPVRSPNAATASSSSTASRTRFSPRADPSGLAAASHLSQPPLHGTAGRSAPKYVRKKPWRQSRLLQYARIPLRPLSERPAPAELWLPFMKLRVAKSLCAHARTHLAGRPSRPARPACW